jgi:hypothetical protein
MKDLRSYLIRLLAARGKNLLRHVTWILLRNPAWNIAH